MAEQCRADEIDDQPEHRDRHRLAIVDGSGRDEALCALPDDPDRDCGEHQCRGKAGEAPELARSEAVARVVGPSPGKPIGQRRHPERKRVGRHVPAVGGQRHRAGNRPDPDFGNHHHRRQADDPANARLVARMRVAEEVMAVRGGLVGNAIHHASIG